MPIPGAESHQQAMIKADGVSASVSSVERALRRKGLLLPARYLADRRENARCRKERFVSPPTRRNRVWQMDFSRFETAAGGSWNISALMDYATKLCVAAPITGTQGARDAVGTLRVAIEAAEELLGAPVIEDCVDLETGEIAHLTVVTDNGPAYKSDAFMRFVMARPELERVRTRHYSPGQNGSSSASTARSSTSTSTARRSLMRSSWMTRSGTTATSTTGCDPMRRWARSHP